MWIQGWLPLNSKQKQKVREEEEEGNNIHNEQARNETDNDLCVWGGWGGARLGLAAAKKETRAT